MSAKSAVLCAMLVALIGPTPGACAAGDTGRAAAPTDALGSYRIHSTPRGTGVLVPNVWRVTSTPSGLRVSLPEPDSQVYVVERAEADAAGAVDAAWSAVGRAMPAPAEPAADKAGNGWAEAAAITYEPPAGAGRVQSARAYRADAGWTVVLADLAPDAARTRRVALATLESQLLAPGFRRESFAGRVANPLDPARVAALGAFVERAREGLGIPGVALGPVQGGRTVFAGGFGQRVHGRPEPVDADTRFAIGSNTKALTSLMLAKLVDGGQLQWDTPVTEVMPDFRTADPETTQRIRVRHLLCACTGLPRHDAPNWYEYGTPEEKIRQLAGISPTTPFGEVFQYSNQMGVAAGYVGARALYPDMPVGEAYDRAMQALVFDPLGMRDTTFDFAAAQAGNFVEPHGEDATGAIAVMTMDTNRSAIPLRPAGGAWSTVNDMLRYVRMELAGGRLPDGSRYIAPALLADRTRANVEDGILSHYGMGLSTDYGSGVPVVYHGGGMAGMLTDMIWLPEHGVGAVILTNADSGGLLLAPFRRKLLELLFDGEPRADTELSDGVAANRDQRAAERKRLTLPADAKVLAALAPRYRHPTLGALDIRRDGARLQLDFGEWRSDAATWTEADGATYLRLASPGFVGGEYRVGTDADGRRTLSETVRGEVFTFVESD